MPDAHALRGHSALQPLTAFFTDPALWHLHRRSVSYAFAVGLFVAWMPVPFQMLLAAGVAVLARVNLPISVGLVWVSNPLTMAPMFYFAYQVGASVSGTEPDAFAFELSFDWLLNGLTAIWQPFLLGCLLLAILSSVVGAVFVRIFWRLRVLRNRRRRRNPGMDA